MKKLFLISFLICVTGVVSAQTWNASGDNSTTGNLTVGKQVKADVVNGKEVRSGSISGDSTALVVDYKYGGKGNLIFAAEEFSGFKKSIVLRSRHYARISNHNLQALEFLTADGQNPLNPQVKMILSPEGRLGIGTTKPTEMLDVAGTINADLYKGKVMNPDALRVGNYTQDSSSVVINYNYYQGKGELIFQGKHNNWLEGKPGVSIIRSQDFGDKVIGSQSQSLQFLTSPFRNTLPPEVRMLITPDGKVGIGNMDPKQALDVTGTIKGDLIKGKVVNGDQVTSGSLAYADSSSIVLQNKYGGKGEIVFLSRQLPNFDTPITIRSKHYARIDNVSMPGLEFITADYWDPRTPKVRMTLTPDGKLGIGKKPTEMLDVAGTIKAHEVVVEIPKGADFVFENDYKLRPLSELETFVKQNKHLPEVQSEKDMQENGLSMNDFQIKLLQKIEELTLYIIAQDKRIEELERSKQ